MGVDRHQFLWGVRLQWYSVCWMQSRSATRRVYVNLKWAVGASMGVVVGNEWYGTSLSQITE
jgi:hypothetical protein